MLESLTFRFTNGRAGVFGDRKVPSEGDTHPIRCLLQYCQQIERTIVSRNQCDLLRFEKLF